MYFDRPKYKEFAKKQLNGRWLYPILISAIIFIILEILNAPQLMRTYNFITSSESSIALLNGDFMDIASSISDIQRAYSTWEAIVQGIIENILIVAALSVFIKMSRSPDKVPFNEFFAGFSDWWRALIAYLWELLWVFLWALLFIIPGIVKAFEYSQTEYLIAEFKNLSPIKAMNISKIITKGYKGSLFVMTLSFLPWDILCIMTCGLGSIFLTPYKQMSYVNAYHAMLKDALENGKILMEDLGE